MARPRTRAVPTTRNRPYAGPGERADPAQRPYGSWYPLVRLGHFILMIFSSCLIIALGLGLLSVLIYLGISLTK